MIVGLAIEVVRRKKKDERSIYYIYILKKKQIQRVNGGQIRKLGECKLH